MQRFMMFLALVLAGGPLSIAAPPREPIDREAPTNVLFILADDLGAGDLGCTGHPYARTPHLDRLAAEGIRFTNGYMAAAWCAPSRYALMRGRFPARNFHETQVLPADQPCITSLLDARGYVTAHFGKWHLGKPQQHAPPPSAYGIDESFTTLSTGPGWTREQMQRSDHRATSTDAYVDMTIDFLQQHGGEPFYINLWISPTHSYIDPTPEQLAEYHDLQFDAEDFENPLQRDFLAFVAEHGDVAEAMKAYCADVTAMDAAVGRLLKHLDHAGLTQNTLVVFSSDNGPGPLCNNWDAIVRRYGQRPTLLNNVGSAGPYRDRKISLHEGGIRVPWIAKLPERIPAGRVDRKSVICGVDWLPTICALTDTKVPDASLDGIDVSAALLGTTLQRQRPIYWRDRPNWTALRDGRWKAHLRNGELSLYDLQADPSESNDLSQQKTGLAERMRKRLEQFNEEAPASPASS